MLLGRESSKFLIIQALQCCTYLRTSSTPPWKSRDKMPAEDVVSVQISTNICVSVFWSHVDSCNGDFSLLWCSKVGIAWIVHLIMRISQSNWSGVLTYLDPLLYSFFMFKEWEGYICRMRDDSLETRDSEEDARVGKDKKFNESFHCNAMRKLDSAL